MPKPFGCCTLASVAFALVVWRERQQRYLMAFGAIAMRAGRAGAAAVAGICCLQTKEAEGPREPRASAGSHADCIENGWAGSRKFQSVASDLSPARGPACRFPSRCVGPFRELIKRSKPAIDRRERAERGYYGSQQR